MDAYFVDSNRICLFIIHSKRGLADSVFGGVLFIHFFVDTFILENNCFVKVRESITCCRKELFSQSELIEFIILKIPDIFGIFRSGRS